MVCNDWLGLFQCPGLSVLALSSRFDGLAVSVAVAVAVVLSVLALSSRFDGRRSAVGLWRLSYLSVLALSSRFDGPRC